MKILEKEKIEKKILEQNRKLLKDFSEERFAKEFLIDLSKFERPNYDKVMLFGINPGGDGEALENAPDFYFEFFLDNEMCKEIKIDKSRYMRLNSELFDKIDKRIFWSEFKYEYVLENFKRLDNYEKFLDKFESMYNTEKMKNGPLLIFSNLFLYCDSNQQNLEKELAKSKEEDILNYVKEFLNYNIDYYNPKLIVVSNTYASRLVMKALGTKPDVDKLEYRNISIIFSRTVYPRNRLDRISRERLKSQIKYEWEKVIR